MEFIDSLSNKEEKHKQSEQQNCTTTALCNEEEESANVWSDSRHIESVDTENT